MFAYNFPTVFCVSFQGSVPISALLLGFGDGVGMRNIILRRYLQAGMVQLVPYNTHVYNNVDYRLCTVAHPQNGAGSWFSQK